MKNNTSQNESLLAQVGERVSEILANTPTQSEFLNKKRIVKVAAGFTFETEEANIEEAEKLLKRTMANAENYSKKRTAFENDLQKKGVPTPIAFLPVKMFNDICLKFDLVRLSFLPNSKKVRTGVSVAEMNHFFTLSKAVKTTEILLGLAAFVSGMLFFGVGSLLSAGGVLTVTVAVMVFFRMAAGWVKKKEVKKNLVSLCFPGGAYGSEVPVTVNIPDLPSEFAPIMAKINTLQLYTAVHNSAISIDFEEVETYVKQYQRDEELKEKEARRLAREAWWQRRIEAYRNSHWYQLWNDPVVYSLDESKTVVAVHFQFGNFPKEKEFIEYIQKLNTADIAEYL